MDPLLAIYYELAALPAWDISRYQAGQEPVDHPTSNLCTVCENTTPIFYQCLACKVRILETHYKLKGIIEDASRYKKIQARLMNLSQSGQDVTHIFEDVSGRINWLNIVLEGIENIIKRMIERYNTTVDSDMTAQAKLAQSQAALASPISFSGQLSFATVGSSQNPSRDEALFEAGEGVLEPLLDISYPEPSNQSFDAADPYN